MLGLVLLFLLFKSGLNNYIQMALQFNPGDAKVAYALAGIPGKLFFAQKIILLLLAVLFFARKSVIFSIVFLFSFFNEYVTVLPLIAIVLFLSGNLQPRIKNALIAFASVYTFAELLMSIPNNPVQGAFFTAPALFLILLVASFLVLQKKVGRWVSVSVILGLASLGIWNCMNWDSRNDSQKESEMQMDAFFDEPIFPQIENRGRMLYVVDRELPLQSRFVFLNGSYADETINVGEIFYKGQRIDARKRKSALLYGDTTPANVNGFLDEIASVYDNPDTLAARFDYLCNVGEISHLVTQYNNLPLKKIDSMYLNVKEKYVYLYGCNQ